MSLSPEVYKCTECSFTQPIKGYPIQYVYSHEDFLVDIPRSTSWCDECNSIVNSEYFLDVMKLPSKFQPSDSDKQILTIKLIVSLRKSPPRCLECGSTNITQIEKINSKEEMHIKGSALHPECGGYLYYMEDEECPFRVSFNYSNPTIRMYDIEGLYIGTKKRT